MAGRATAGAGGAGKEAAAARRRWEEAGAGGVGAAGRPGGSRRRGGRKAGWEVKYLGALRRKRARVGGRVGSPTLTFTGWSTGWELDPQIFLRV